MSVTFVDVTIVVASAVCGCFATSFVFGSITGKPIFAIAGDWRKQLYAILFALPALLILNIGWPLALALPFFVIWLILAPSISAKYIFGAKKADWTFLLMLHSAYAFTTVALILLLERLFQTH